VKGREEGKRFWFCRFSKDEQLSIAQPSTFGQKKKNKNIFSFDTKTVAKYSP